MSAETIYIYKGYSYHMLDNNNIALCGWDNSSPDLVIPDELDGSIFTEVSNFALRDNTEITSLLLYFVFL